MHKNPGKKYALWFKNLWASYWFHTLKIAYYYGLCQSLDFGIGFCLVSKFVYFGDDSFWIDFCGFVGND